jgi:thiol-disulfide isomerase/thioredoxin
LLRRPETIEPERPVPPFRLAKADCRIVDSRELVGKQPFVVVFFATWCGVCKRKLPLLQRALAAHAGRIETLFVSLDDAETWPEVGGYLEEHGFDASVSPVRGYDFLGFSLGYNPFGGVPVAVVVGRSGYVIDVQIGVRQHDYERFMQALDEAIAEDPAQL